MTARIVRRRGQPVAALLLVFAGWFAARSLVWESPFPAPIAAVMQSAQELIVHGGDEEAGEQLGSAQEDLSAIPLIAAPPELWLTPVMFSAATAVPTVADPALADRLGPEAPALPRRAGEHSFLAAATTTPPDGAREVSGAITEARDVAASVPPVPSLTGDSARITAGRWSGDAWVLLRNDTTTPVTSGRGSYGQSQAGAVVRYRIAPSSGHRPAVYARASAALAAEAQPEAAVGLTGRPMPEVPVAVSAEVRAADLHTGTELRPAVFAYSEFPPRELPFGTRAEAYLQVGYVGGRYATAFIDGQLRIDRAVAGAGTTGLRAGVGAWGGAQDGVKRLDLGPAATVVFTLAGAPFRMSADWRFRVAGRANPSSGPALTVSTGF